MPIRIWLRWRGASTLLERIGYTKFYAIVLGRDTSEFSGIYERAVEHVLKPRLLFPEKAAFERFCADEREYWIGK